MRKVLARQPGVGRTSSRATTSRSIAMNVERKPFDDLRVHQRGRLRDRHSGDVEGSYSAGAVVATSNVAPGMMGENRAVRAYPHRRSAGASPVGASGVPHRLCDPTLCDGAATMHAEPRAGSAEAIQADLRAAGIDVTLQPFDLGVFLYKRCATDPMCLIGLEPGTTATPDKLHATYQPTARSRDGPKLFLLAQR